jgi:uncharacterized integral membrane protein
MKKIKIIFWVLLLALLAAVVYQNQAELMAPVSIELNAWKAGTYVSPDVPMIVIFAGLFLLGFLIAYAYGLYGSYKQGKTIKHLNATVAAQTEEIQALRGQLDALQPPAAPTAPASPSPGPSPDATPVDA